MPLPRFLASPLEVKIEVLSRWIPVTKLASVHELCASSELPDKTLPTQTNARPSGNAPPAEQVLMLVKLGKLKNPYFDLKEAIPFTSCYLTWRTRQLINLIMGQPRQLITEQAPTRGAAAVQVLTDQSQGEKV